MIGIESQDQVPAKRAARKEADLPPASGDRQECTDDAGQATTVVEWFGFKRHLLVDVTHEAALADEITGANAGELSEK